MTRDEVPGRVSRLLDGRPVRWAPSSSLFGDYDGRERTLDVFDAEPRDQRRLRGDIDRALREELQTAAGGPVIVIFHSIKQSAARYGEFVRSFPRALPDSAPILPLSDNVVDEPDESLTHRRRVA